MRQNMYQVHERVFPEAEIIQPRGVILAREGNVEVSLKGIQMLNKCLTVVEDI